jgi:hypothetical protein
MSFAEEWRPIYGFTGYYEVSSWGRVRSVDRIVAGSCYGVISHRKGVVLAGGGNNAGYRQVGLFKKNKGKLILVHRLVLKAFYGKCPKGKESRHLDGDSANNRVDNLVWGTRAENIADRWKHQGGVFCLAPNNKKLTPRIVRFIRKRHDEGVSLDYLARKFKVSYPTVWSVFHRRSWAHVK